MEKQPEFKKNLWGYDKEAVLKYIDEMSRTAAQSEAALQEKVSQIAHSREELEGQIAEFEQKLQHISVVLDTEKGKNKSLSEMIVCSRRKLTASADILRRVIGIFRQAGKKP